MVCCCSNPVCTKFGCQSWANIQPPTNFIGFSHPVTVTSIHPLEKKPHKCPVCDGLGKCTLFVDGICNPCEGKGIVWG